MQKLVCGDVLTELIKLESESVDLVVTDPPYNSNLEWDRKTNEWQFKWLEEVKRVMKDGASLYVFFAPMNMYEIEGWIRNNLTLKNVIVWHHPNLYGAGMSYGKDRYKSSWDVVLYAVKGKAAKHGKNVSSTAYRETGRGFDVVIESQPRPLLHKAQKPFGIIEKFIRSSSNEGDIVLDPFVGVGTTLIVCEKLNRKGIGIDLIQDNIDIANKRLENLDRLKEIDKEIWQKKRISKE